MHVTYTALFFNGMESDMPQKEIHCIHRIQREFFHHPFSFQNFSTLEMKQSAQINRVLFYIHSDYFVKLFLHSKLISNNS